MSDTLTDAAAEDYALRNWTFRDQARMRIGSEAHKQMFCRMLLETHNPYKPAVLDWPPLMATASSAPGWPAGSEPAQPAGSVTAGFQTIVSTCGTPGVNRTGLAAVRSQAAESQTTWPCRVTTTCTEPTPYDSMQGAAEVETA